MAANGTRTTRRLVKSNIARKDLPRIFKTLELLDMNFEELSSLYREFQEDKS